MSNELAIRSFAELERMSKLMSRSTLFNDSPENVGTKILAGRELGMGPVMACQCIIVVKGKPSLTAQAWSALIKRHPSYNYKVVKHSRDECLLNFYENGELQGPSEFTMEDAKNAGLSGDNWRKYPKAMLFARALTQGARMYCPDVGIGSIYTPEELGDNASLDPDEMIEAENVTVKVVENEAGYFDPAGSDNAYDPGDIDAGNDPGPGDSDASAEVIEVEAEAPPKEAPREENQEEDGGSDESSDDDAPVGADGAAWIFDRLKERAVTLEQLVAFLKKECNATPVLKGKEYKPEEWPRGLRDDIMKFNGCHDRVSEPEWPEAGSPAIQYWEVMRWYATIAWLKRGPVKPKRGHPKTPTELAEAAMESETIKVQGLPARARAFVEACKGGQIQFESGDVIDSPF
jgi:hypothetical protein